jgi:hypothetical protein
MERRATEVIIDLYPLGPDAEDCQTLIFRPPNSRFDVNLVDRLREVGIDTFGPVRSAPRTDYILAPSVRNGSGDGPISDVLEFALVAVTGGVMGNAAYDAFKRFARSLTSSDAREPKPLTEAEATVWGLTMIARQYKLPVDELRLLAVTLAEPNATVCAKAPDGSVYTADVEVIDGLAVLGQSTRALPSTSV